MATEIEEDAWRVLKALANWSEQEGDPNKGRYEVSGAELQTKLGIEPTRINDAVEYLLGRGFVDRQQTFGTAPYSFREVWLETPGRLAYQQSSAEGAQISDVHTNYDVFLSHSSLDDALTEDVKHLLEGNGIRTFSTPGSVPTGSWEPQIEEALRTSSTIWVLLTPIALRESVWAHHEFGYFYGYNHGKGRDLEGHDCRFLYSRGTELRGLYAWIQGTQVESFEDPVTVAETIAVGLEKEFRVPADWQPRTYPQQSDALVRHPALGPVSFSSSGLTHGPGTAQVTMGIRDIGETIYYVAALSAHPKVELTQVTPADAVGPSYSGSVVLQLRYRDQPVQMLPTELTDVRGRRFSVLPGPRSPQGKTPLLITFETEDRRALAAVFYYIINDHPKGFPELSLHAPVPLDWWQGMMPPA